MIEANGGQAPKISALVVVYNEEAILEECLKRLAWVDEIVVALDKCTDRSKEIALAFGARLLEGAWEIEGDRRNTAIEFCRTEWIVEIDADEWVTPDLAAEIRQTINEAAYDIYDLKVDNYVGDRLIHYGWGGGSLGKDSYNGLFRKGVKSWGDRRLHPHITVSGSVCPQPLQNPIVHKIFADIAEIIHRLDRNSSYRAKDLVDHNEVGTLADAARKFLSRFWKIYIRRRAWKEKEIGFVLAMCSALYPLISQIKAVNEEMPMDQPGQS